MILGIGGWRALEALGLQPSVAHLNQGHAAFVVLERARRFMGSHRVSFREALWATRAANVFTTHTPVAAGFDSFATELMEKYFPARGYPTQLGISSRDLFALGRRAGDDLHEPFNMAYLAMRGCARVNGVSRLHGSVSQRLFAELYPRWPAKEVPVNYVTNGIHVPTWDSQAADELWTRSCGKARWGGAVERLRSVVATMSDEDLWGMRNEERAELVTYARSRLAVQLVERGSIRVLPLPPPTSSGPACSRSGLRAASPNTSGRTCFCATRSASYASSAIRPARCNSWSRGKPTPPTRRGSE